jgi:hypothetical protein
MHFDRARCSIPCVGFMQQQDHWKAQISEPFALDKNNG